MGIYQKSIDKISEKSLGMLLLGKMLIVLVLGAMFSRQLITYGYFILIAGTLLVANYVSINFKNWKQKSRGTLGTHYVGGAGAMLLLLFLGIQSPQVPFQIIILILGIVLIIPSIIEIIRGKKK